MLKEKWFYLLGIPALITVEYAYMELRKFKTKKNGVDSGAQNWVVGVYDVRFHNLPFVMLSRYSGIFNISHSLLFF